MLLAFVITSVPLHSQGLGTTTGTLAGDVSDENQVELPGVLISVSNDEGTRTITTDSTGKYIFPYLNPGTYNVRAELQGFSTVEKNDIRIGLGQRIEISFRMKAAVHESVIVTGETPLVNLTSTSTVTNISDEFANKIPIGRSLADMIFLAPGVVKSGIAGANFSISGGPGLGNTYFVDGVNVTHPGFGGLGSVSFNQTAGIRKPLGGNGLPVEMVKEVQVITSGFEPEYGESRGGIINVLTKTGNNNFHGQGYTYFTPPAAGDIFTKGEVGADAGINTGGAIIKNKLFFFGAYNFTSSKTKFFSLPDAPGYAVLKDATNQTITNSYSGKITANPTSQHTVEFSASGDPSFRPLSNQDGLGLDSFVNPKLAQSEWQFGTNTQSLRWNGILRPDIFIEVEAGRFHTEYFNNPNPLYRDVPRVIDTTGIDLGGMGGNLDFYGSNWEYSAKFTNLWKNHQFRYGLQYEDISYSSIAERTGGPFTAFDNDVVTSGYRVDIVNGEDWGQPYPLLYVVQALHGSPLFSTKSKYFDWFAQDSWAITSNLNLTLGVRWELQNIQGKGKDATEVTFNNNWAPRIGATYDYLKNGNSKIFAHYGRFYEKLPNQVGSGFTPSLTSYSIFSDEKLTNLLDSYLGVGVLGRGTSEVEGYGSSTSLFRTGAQYLTEWTAGIEQEVKPGISIGAHFIHRNTDRVVENVVVDTNGACINLPQGGCTYKPLTVEEDVYVRDLPGIIGVLTNVDGHLPGVPALVRHYNAIEFTINKRVTDRWQLMGSYRYARLNGNYEGNSNLSAAANYAVSPFNSFSYVEGPLPDDIRNMVKLFSSYEWRHLNTGVAFYFQTGRPISAYTMGSNGDFGTFLVSRRGAYGRTDSITSFDIHADYRINVLRNQQVTVGFDVFNLFNSHGVTAVNEIKQEHDNILNIEPRDDFLTPTEQQPSRSYRFLLRYSF